MGESKYIIASKVTFFAIFRLQPKFTLVSTLFWWANKILVFTLFPKKVELIFGQVD